MYFPSCTTAQDESYKDLSKDGQTEHFRKCAYKVIDYIHDYSLNVEKKRIHPSVEAGYLRPLFPENPPEEPEEFDKILKDFDDKIMPGINHWRHPQFYAYFFCGNALPNVIGDMLSGSVGGIGFSWTAQPALTELETIMMDWLGRALHLPKQFLFKESKGKGGGNTQASASDALFSVFTTARFTKLKELGCYSLSNSITCDDPVPPCKFMDRLVAYTSTEAHSCIEKAANIAMIEIRLLKPNQNRQMTAEILEEAIVQDIKHDRIPLLFAATMGTTGTGAIDDIEGCGVVCQKYGIWFHVDGAYGGNPLLLPELAHQRKGLEYVWSMNINPPKMMLGAIDSTCLWLRDIEMFKQPWLIQATYYLNRYQYDSAENLAMSAIDYRHFGVPLSKRWRALKFYFLLRMYGIKGLQAYQRRLLHVAKVFEKLVRSDDRFLVTSPPVLGIVCIRQKGPIESMVDFNYVKSDCEMSHCNRLNMNLVYRLNEVGKIHLCPYVFNGLYHLRFAINYEWVTEEHVMYAWQAVQESYVTELDEEWRTEREKKSAVEEKHINELKSEFSFVNVIHGQRESSHPRLSESFGAFSFCEDVDEKETLFRN